MTLKLKYKYIHEKMQAITSFIVLYELIIQLSGTSLKKRNNTADIIIPINDKHNTFSKYFIYSINFVFLFSFDLIVASFTMNFLSKKAINIE